MTEDFYNPLLPIEQLQKNMLEWEKNYLEYSTKYRIPDESSMIFRRYVTKEEMLKTLPDE